MAKSKQEKKELLNDYSAKLKNSKSVIILKTKNLTPNEVNTFRKTLHDFDSVFHVVKNTIFKIALKENDFDEVESLNDEVHAVLFTNEDIVSPSKLLKKFVEETEMKEKKENKVEIVAGFLDGDKLTYEQVIELAEMPSKEESISMILGILDQAISGVVNVLEDAPRAVVSVLDQAFKEE